MRHVFACGYSRSGTTLLATILDSHPAIAMGYELMPLGLPPLARAIEALEQAAARSDDPAGDLQADPATKALGVFLVHCAQARVAPGEALEVLKALHAGGMRRVGGLGDRIAVATAVVERKRANEGASLSGFKANTPRVGAVERAAPGSAYVFIVRDPRDVLASQHQRGFGRSAQQVGRHWARYVSRFRRFAARHPEHTALIRYEDLVTDRDGGLAAIFGAVGLDYGEEVVRFYDSNASIHGTRHNNAPNVGRDLYTSSIGRWREDLTDDEVRHIVRRCGRQMAAVGYQV